MTLANVAVFSGPYIATLGQTTFAYAFKVFADSDEELVVSVDGTVIATTEYSVTGVGNPSGGDVIFNTGLNAGQVVLIEGQMDPEQLQAYTPGGKFPASSHELGLDRIVRMVQMLLHQQGSFLSIGNAGLIAQPPFNAILPSPTDGVLQFESGVFSWIDNPGLPAQSGQNGRLLTTDGASAFWRAFVDFFPSLQAGQFLTTDGATLSWAVPSGGGASLPDQTGQAGKVLGTTGVTAIWQTLEQVLPTLVANRVLGNNGTILQWQLGLPALPAPPPPGEFPVLQTDGVTVAWQNLLPTLVADQRLAVDGAGTGLVWLPPELPADPTEDSLLRFDFTGSTVEWTPEAPFVPNYVLASNFSGADDTAILQNALNSAAAANQWLIIDRTFTITSVDIPSNSTIWMAAAIGILAEAASPPSDNGLFNIHGSAGVTIYGNGALIDGNNQFATESDHHGIDIAGAGRVVIQDLRINRCSGDGIHIGPTRTAGANFTSNSHILRVSCVTNNGNGIRVASGRNVIVEGGFQSNNGVLAASAPGNAGVAIIPTATTDELAGVFVKDVETAFHGIGAGIHIDLTPWNGFNIYPNISIERHFSHDGDMVGWRYWGYQTGNILDGAVRYIDGHVIDTLEQGISVEGTDRTGPQTFIIRPMVRNPNTSSSATAQHRTGIFVGSYPGSPGGSSDAGNCIIYEPQVIDQANPPNTSTLIQVENLAVSQQLEDVLIINPIRFSWLSTLIRLQVVMSGRRGNVDVIDTRRILRYTALSIDETIDRQHGNAVYTNSGLTARRTYTLQGPFFEDSPPIRFEVSDPFPIRVVPSTGTRFIGGGGNDQWIESRVPGSTLTVRETLSGDFEILERTGQWFFESEQTDVALGFSGQTIELTMYTRTFAADALSPGDMADMFVSGDVPLGTGTNTLRFRLNGVEILSDDVNGGSTESWEVHAKVFINSPTEAQVRVFTYTRVDRVRHECISQAIDITTAITLSVSVQNSSTSGFVTKRISTCQLTHHNLP